MLSQLLVVALLIYDYFFTPRLIENIGFIPVFLAIGTTTAVILVEKSSAKNFANYIVVQSAITLLFAAGLIFVIPIDSIYSSLAYLIILTSQYWLGPRGFIASYAVVLSASLVGMVVQNNVESIDWHGFVVFQALLFLTGIIISELFSDLQRDRRHLQQATNNVVFERERLESLINSMTDAVIATTEEGVVTAYNGAALELLDTNKSPLGVHFNSLMQIFDENDEQIVIFDEKRDDSIIKHDDWHFINQDNEKIDLYMSLSPIITESSAINNGFILVLRDITKEKSLEEQRDDFVSIVSHELRTPLAIAEANLSTAQLPAIKNDVEKQQPLLEQAYKNVLFLSDLVNDITTISRAERGILENETEEFDPVELITELEKDYVPKTAEKGLRFNVKIDERIPKVFSNRHRVKEVLQDFITNAVKYTEEGGVSLILQQKNNSTLRFSVKDSGIGISQTDQKHIFSKFYRSEDFRTRDHNGTGLGLFIATKLVELIGGEIGVSSEINKGSTFWLDLPIKLVPDSVVTPESFATSDSKPADLSS
ncbi:PAS domain-containing protein [Candidatus Saccharibacteria bacterium]|nr:PAS domain-containing protein [Candidatus Saccharibacteria bacterium]